MVKLQLVPRLDADHRGELRWDLTALNIGSYRCRGCGLKTRTYGGMWKHLQQCFQASSGP